MPQRYPLAELLQHLSSGSADELLEHFLTYVGELGMDLYPAQEEAILELLSGKHVILATPTGSGKSLVATALVFRTLASGGRAFYTCPIKALVNEKFFQLTDAFGPSQVGMMTGDATINPEAPVICCTAEIAASMALRSGISAPIDALIMDEFHYYADKERGIAWQIPLLLLERTHFLLMSATLGDSRPFLERLERLTKRGAVLVESKDRPVPLDFTYSEETLHETVKSLVEKGKSPIYIVCFTQRACAEEAQNLMSENYTTKEEKRAILEALVDTQFDSTYGKDMQRFLKQGVGIHHAGLLPKYRLTVEKLAQTGKLKVICGTDTLGVGVNIPIRTVLFTRLCKFDGEKVVILGVREFQQIAGRAGRKGFDIEGSVVVQAPEHVIENIRIDRKKENDPKKHKNLQRAKPPIRGYVHWDRTTFDKLVSGMPEELLPRFAISHGMLIDLLDNPEAGKRGGYGMMLDLIAKSHLTERDKRKERKQAPLLFRSLRRAGLVELIDRPSGKRGKLAAVASTLQRDFSLHHALSLWLIDFVQMLADAREEEDERVGGGEGPKGRAAGAQEEQSVVEQALDETPAEPTDEAAAPISNESIEAPAPVENAHPRPLASSYALDVLSAVEAILESPRLILERQLDKLKGDRIAELKAAGVEYEERMAIIEKLDYPKPNAELTYATFETFVKFHPWAGLENIRPKSIARDMFERFATFHEYVRELDLSRVEGVLLRYLSDVVKTLEQSVPEFAKTDELDAIYWFLRDEVRGVDSSLLDEWEHRMLGRVVKKTNERALEPPLLRNDPKALLVRVRKDLHRFLKLLSSRDWAAASAMVKNAADWPASRIEEAMKPYFEARRTLLVHHEARKAEFTTMRQVGDASWEAWQTMVDPEEENDWSVEVVVELSDETMDSTSPILDLKSIAG